jgi:DNA invertase Pin-like site-specific DNA recombinase
MGILAQGEIHVVRGQKKFVAYYRVSTDKQGVRGLGMEAQASCVEAFVASHDGKILASFKEVESGKRNDRPELDKALARSRALGATLLIAKLDRLSRDALFLLTLQKANVDFVCCDMPDANNFTVGIMALMAQHEREAISTRTRDALAVVKQRVTIHGQQKHPEVKRLGNPNGARALQRDPSKLKLGYKRAVAANQSRAVARANDLAPILAELRAEGIVSANAQAKALNERQYLTPRGGRWTARSVINAAERSAP